MEEVPSDTFKKEKLVEERKGIIRKDWFNKILNKVLSWSKIVSGDDSNDV